MPSSVKATEPTVLDRLVSAADEALREVDIDAVTIQAVAVAAGVSRATAFRQLGRREDMIVAVGVLRAARFARDCAIEMDSYATVFEQIEAGCRYLVRELPADSVMRALLMMQTAADIGAETRELAVATFGPVVDRGRHGGMLRTDVSAERILTWIVEQLYLAIQQPDRSDEVVRERVRLFLIPALMPPRDAASGAVGVCEQVDALAATLAEVTRVVAAIREQVLPTTDT